MKRYKALIVDDEHAARETLRLLVDWETLGFDAPVLASNAEEALRQINETHFDIIFADIEMPVMNGIELIKRIKEMRPNQRIVIISCHEKFDYAVQAFRLGVEDYMIKELLTPNELRACLCSIVTSDVTGAAAHADNNEMNALLKDAANGRKLASAPLPYGDNAVFLIVLDDYVKLKLERGARRLAQQTDAFARSIESAAMYDDEKGNIYILCDVSSERSILFFINAAITYANTIRMSAHKLNLQRVSIGVSDPVSDCSELAIACSQAKEAANMRIIEGFDKTILFNGIAYKKSVLDFDRLDYLLKRIEELCYNGNTECLKLIEKLYATDTASGFADMNYYRYVNSKLWSMLVVLAQSKGYEYAALFKDEGLDINQINRLENSGIMAQVFVKFILKLISSDTVKENEDIVDNVLHIIEQEYTNDISLSDLSERLHTNKSYLCRVFKEHMGENLTQYIIKKKIERAKYLLYNTNMKLYEIADALGFTSQPYFSYVFKKYAGCSPQEYKKGIREYEQNMISR